MGVNAETQMAVKFFYGEEKLDVKYIIENAILRYIEREVMDNENDAVDLFTKKNL